MDEFGYADRHTDSVFEKWSISVLEYMPFCGTGPHMTNGQLAALALTFNVMFSAMYKS